MNKLAFVFLAVIGHLSGCTNIQHLPKSVQTAIEEPVCGSSPRKIAVFFDGTANDEGSDTNVKRLHSLVTLQNRANIATLYLQGVGVGQDMQGAVTGGGINARVKIAYEFVLNHYRPEGECRPADEVYIFGFSRGAYSARILTTMLYFGGNVEPTDRKHGHTSTDLADIVHKTVFGPLFGRVDQSARERTTVALLEKQGVKPYGKSKQVQPITVNVLGLWDTVEALGPKNFLPSTFWIDLHWNFPEVNVDSVNFRYGERLCNVERALHAVSLDDNRATVFTPLLLTRKHLFVGCPFDQRPSGGGQNNKRMIDSEGRVRPSMLKEVWFAGAHSDVGGGYNNSALSGVSLNWMLSELEVTGLLPKGASVRQDEYGTSHNPASGAWSILYPEVNRDITSFALEDKIHASTPGAEDEKYNIRGPLPEFAGTICVHPSVLNRRQLIGIEANENHQLSLKREGRVQVKPTAYGKRRSWVWRAEVLGEVGPDVQELVVNVYPNCHAQDQK